MKREEELKEEFRMFCAIVPKTMVVNEESIFNILKMGTEWADQHPRKGLWDAEKVIKFIKDNVREYHKSGVFHIDDFINSLRKEMEE